MDFIDTLPSLAVFNEELPYPNTLDEAYFLAELARMCHARLDADVEAPAKFWKLLNDDEAERLYGFLTDVECGVSKAANVLQMLVEPQPVPFGECDDVCDTATDAIRCVNARLQRLGRQLDSSSRDELQLALEKVLGEAAVEFIDDEDNRVDPNEPPPEVEGMFSLPNLINDLQVMAEQSNERFLSLVDKTIRDNADKPELIAEIREIEARSLRCQAALDKHREEKT
jgi:hypothetical protein